MKDLRYFALFFIVSFMAGKRLYTIKDPEGNVMVQVVKCISVSTLHLWAKLFVEDMEGTSRLE